MSEIKIKNKKVCYSESLIDNNYKLDLKYTKPANAHNNAQIVELSITARFNNREQYGKKELEVYIYGKRNERSIYLNGRVSNYDNALNVWVNMVVEDLSEADKDMIQEAVYEITKLSTIFNQKDIQLGADNREIYDQLKDNLEEQKELADKISELKAQYTKLLNDHNLTELEASSFVQLVSEGAEVGTMLNNIKELMR